MQSREFVNQLEAVIDVAMSLGYRSMDDIVEEGRNRMQRAVHRRHYDAQRAVRFMDLRQPVRPWQDTIATVEPSICSVVNVVHSLPSRENVMETVDDFPCWVFLNYSVGVVVGQQCPHFIQIVLPVEGHSNVTLVRFRENDVGIFSHKFARCVSCSE